MIIRFTVPLPPRGQARPRAVARFAGGRMFAGTYKDAKERKSENKVLSCALPFRPEVPLNGPLKLTIRSYLEVPKSKTKKFRAAALNGEIRPTGKPDLSNIIKHIEDALNGSFWKDDCQIVQYGEATGKYYGDPARYEIEVMELDVGASKESGC